MHRVIQTSLNDKRYCVTGCMNDMKRIHISHAIRLLSIDSQHPVIYLTQINNHLYYC